MTTPTRDTRGRFLAEGQHEYRVTFDSGDVHTLRASGPSAAVALCGERLPPASITDVTLARRMLTRERRHRMPLMERIWPERWPRR